MDFNLTMEQQMIRDVSRDFAENEIAPRARELDERAEFPYDIAEKMAELGMMGIPFPESYGGSGGDCISFHLCVEEISRGDVSLGALLDVTCGVAEALYSFGTEDQKKKWLEPLVRGQAIGCFGLTEPDAGSDATAIKTRAVLDGDEWVINGSKTFITNAGLKNMSVMIAVALAVRSKDEPPTLNGFIIPNGTPGLKIGRKLDKLGWRSSDTREVFFEDCRIPEENLFGEPDRGISQALAVLHAARISMAAISVGLARACFDASLKYAKERKAFGKPISRFGRIQDKLANMAMGIKLSQLIIYEASWRKDNGLDFVKEASYAKLFASEHAKYCADQGVQIHGGYGFMNEYDISRYWREVKVHEIAEGTSEIQRLIIARALGCENSE
jgi:short/branched chain acyl-CoA dehydrogenase